MLMCAYCLADMVRDEANAGLDETVVVLTPDGPGLAVTVVDGDALCLTHWTERIGNITKAYNSSDGFRVPISRPGWHPAFVSAVGSVKPA